MKTNYEEFMKDEPRQSFSSAMEYNYFPSMKDGETITVRFMVDSIKDFDLEVVHMVDIDGKQKRVSCLGDNCPLCNAGVNQTKRFFIPMIVYRNNGATQEFVVWDRNKDYAKKLANFINDYGPLSDILCNITRSGQGLETEYTISPNVKSAMRAEYPLKPFPNVEPSRYYVLNRTADEINYFIKNGSFPERVRQNQDTTTNDSVIPDEVADFANATLVSELPKEEPVTPSYLNNGSRPQRY